MLNQRLIKNKTNMSDTLDEILQDVFNASEEQIKAVKHKLMLSIVNNENNGKNSKKCKASIKTGPRRGDLCQAPVEKDGDYCKKHKPDNNMGKWLKEAKRKQEEVAPSRNMIDIQ
jgi:hypothetical protein